MASATDPSAGPTRSRSLRRVFTSTVCGLDGSRASFEAVRQAARLDLILDGIERLRDSA